MLKRRSDWRLPVSSLGSRGRAFARLAAAAALAVAPVARAGNFYWTGDHDNNWNTTGGAAGTNWSSSSAFNQDTQPNLPGSADNVFFILAGAGNLNTVLGQSFSISSLNFTPDAIAADTIIIDNGGIAANALTIGSGGLTDNGAAAITLSANVTVGTTETWANNSTTNFNISGALQGSSNLTLEGTGATTGTATGAFLFSGASTYSGQVALLNDQTSLIIGGNGSFANVTNATASIALNGGSSLVLDNSSDSNNPGAVNSSTRLASTVGITSLGGFVTLLGSSSASTSQTVGTLSIGSGATYVTVTPGGGQSAALTFGGAGVPSFSRVTGGTVTFSSTGTINAANVTLADGIIGGWATIGTTANVNGPLDWATVNGSGNVVPLATYQTLVAAPLATDNSQLLAGGSVTLATGNHTINSLSLGGTVLFATSTNTLTIASGGIISYGGTGTDVMQTGTYQPVGNMAFFGQASTASQPNPQYLGNITSSTSDLTIFTAGNLDLASFITGAINLVKSGPGVLDLSTGNDQNKSANSYTGITIINEGTIIIGQETDLGAVPGSLVSNAITFNGGQLEAFSSITFSANRGITVGTRGGTIFGVAGTGDNIQQPITGTGGITLWTDGFLTIGGGAAGRIQVDNSTAHPNNYQGPTTFLVTPDYSGTGSTASAIPANATATLGSILLGLSNNVPSTSAVTANLVDYTGGNVLPNPYGPTGTLRYYVVNMNGTNQSFGSLAGNLALINMTGTLTLGANNLSTNYSGVIGGASNTTSIATGTGSIVKVGSGTQTFSGANQYTGTTSINGGTLLIGSGTATTSTASLANTAVTVGNGTLTGALGGNGTIGGAVTVTSTGNLAPAMTPTTSNTLTVNNNLTLNAGASLSFNFGAAGSPGTGDLVNLTGTGSLSLAAGTDTLNITPLSGFGIGTYNLITVSGTGTFTDSATFTINGSTTFNYSVAPSGKNLVLNVTAGNPFYYWSGAVSGTPNGSWDLSTANWSGAATTYSNGGNVTFDDVDLAAGGATNVTVAAGGVTPNSITFNNSTNNYTFSGAAINVATSIIKNQAGNATFNNAVTTPLATVAGGSLTVGSTGVFNSTTSVVVQSGATLTVNGTLNTPLLTLAAGANGMSVASTGSLASNTALVVNAPATFNNAAQTLASLTDTSSATTGAITLNGTTLTLSATSAFDGTITGTGRLAVTGGTTLTLSNGGNT
jgi:fibronectin-binding autotransporter adhesin